MSLVLQLSIFLAIVVILFSTNELYTTDTSITKKVVLSIVILVALVSIPYFISELRFVNSQISQVEDLLDI